MLKDVLSYGFDEVNIHIVLKDVLSTLGLLSMPDEEITSKNEQILVRLLLSSQQ